MLDSSEPRTCQQKSHKYSKMSASTRPVYREPCKKHAKKDCKHEEKGKKNTFLKEMRKSLQKPENLKTSFTSTARRGGETTPPSPHHADLLPYHPYAVR